jgi:hypothetical protein
MQSTASMTNPKTPIAPPSRLTLRKTTLRTLGDAALRSVAGGDASRLSFCHLQETQAPERGNAGTDFPPTP